MRTRSSDVFSLRRIALVLVLLPGMACGEDDPLPWPDASHGDLVREVQEISASQNPDPEGTVPVDHAIGPSEAGLPPEADSAPPVEDLPSDRPCPIPGNLLIGEVMANPKAVSDPEGEWFEVWNVAAVSLDLRGLSVNDGSRAFSIEDSVVVPSGGVVVLARNGDPDTNGGVLAQIVLSGLRLPNESGVLRLTCGDLLLDEVRWEKGWPLREGSSLALDPTGADVGRNDSPAWWCRSSEAWNGGDLGSPGRVNPPCGTDSCGDGVVQAWEVCDDGNRSDGDGCPRDCQDPEDGDGDGIPDVRDNCPFHFNAGQEDLDQDGKGDACDPSECGNGVLEPGEQCDDGNRRPGDGCSAACVPESFVAGAVLVTEFLFDPRAVSDGDGEWIEVHNPGREPIDLAGWELSDGDADRLVLDPARGPTVIAPGGYLVLGRNGDPRANGGVPVDYVYGSRFSLRNEDRSAMGGQPRYADAIRLSWNGRVIDEVRYGFADLGFPKVGGRSIQLDPALLDHEWNDEAEAWCTAPDTARLPGGDFGTPGRANPECPP